MQYIVQASKSKRPYANVGRTEGYPTAAKAMRFVKANKGKGLKHRLVLNGTPVKVKS